MEFTVYEHILIVIAVCIIFINVYVTTLFVRKPMLRQTSSLLLFSLTMADLFTGIVTVPLIIASRPLRILGFEKFKIVFILGDAATVMSSSLIIMSLCAVTADRYVRLCYPIKHMVIVRRMRVVALFCFIWITALCYALIPLSWLHKILERNPSAETYTAVDIMDTRYAIASAALFAIPVIGMTLAFARMFYAIHKLGCHEQRLMTNNSQEQRRRKRERKAIIIFTLMFVLFMICWAPWILLRPFVSHEVFAKIPEGLLNTMMLIRFLTSIFNPLLYTLHEHDFHRALIADKDDFLSCILCGRNKRRSSSGTTESFFKLTLLRSSRRGTFNSAQKAQEDADKVTPFVPSPILVRNGHLHPGHVGDQLYSSFYDSPAELRNNFQPYSGPYESATVQHQSSEKGFKDDEPHTPLLSLPVPPISQIGKGDTTISWEIPRAPTEGEMEQTDDLVQRLSYRHKNFRSTYDNVDDVNLGDGDSNRLGNWTGKNKIGSIEKNSRTTHNQENIQGEPLQTLTQEGNGRKAACADAEIGFYGEKQSESESNYGTNHSAKDGRKKQTKKLLQTSFIGRLFDAENLDLKSA